jgi:hypothetical protein
MEEKIVEAFTFGTLQDCKNLKEKLDDSGVSWEEFLSWVEEKKKQFSGEGEGGNRAPIIIRKCPDCSRALTLSSVNAHPTLMVDGDYNSLWNCIDPDCGYEEYRKETFEEELQKYVVIEE